jgi:hypothetical protein
MFFIDTDGWYQNHCILILKNNLKLPGMVAHTLNLSTREVEAAESRV